MSASPIEEGSINPEHKQAAANISAPDSSPVPKTPSFTVLCVTELHTKASDDFVRDVLHREFNKFGGDTSVRMMADKDGKRMAYVYFRTHDDAQEALTTNSQIIFYDKPATIKAYEESQQPNGGGPIDPGSSNNFQNRYQPSGGGMNNQGGGGGNNQYYPSYLNHLPAELDPLATRTLFCGNLELNITEEELRRIFGRYGSVIDVDIKRPLPGTGNAFAFIRFQNLDMSAKAKTELSGQFIGKFQCKIGYGKMNPSSKLWIGGLGTWCSTSTLEKEFDRFGAIQKIEYVDGENQAHIYYETVEAAQAAVSEMRGVHFANTDKYIRIDFSDMQPNQRFYHNNNFRGPRGEGGVGRDFRGAVNRGVYHNNNKNNNNQNMGPDGPGSRGGGPMNNGGSHNNRYSPYGGGGSSSSGPNNQGWQPRDHRPPSYGDNNYGPNDRRGGGAYNNNDNNQYPPQNSGSGGGQHNYPPRSGSGGGSYNNGPPSSHPPPHHNDQPYQFHQGSTGFRQQHWNNTHQPPGPHRSAGGGSSSWGGERRDSISPPPHRAPSHDYGGGGYQNRGRDYPYDGRGGGDLGRGGGGSDYNRRPPPPPHDRPYYGGGPDHRPSDNLRYERSGSFERIADDISGDECDSFSPRHSSNSPLQSCKTIQDLCRKAPSGGWRNGTAFEGNFNLKTSSFPTRMFLLEGSQRMAEFLRRHASQDSPAGDTLKITQRLRMDPGKLDDVMRRMNTCHSYAVFLSMPSNSPSGGGRNSAGSLDPQSDSRPLRNLISYLKSKEAAGVISIQGGGGGTVLYAFPPSPFSMDLLRRGSPYLPDSEEREEHLVVLIVSSDGGYYSNRGGGGSSPPPPTSAPRGGSVGMPSGSGRRSPP